MSKTNKAETAQQAYGRKHLEITRTMSKICKLLIGHEPPADWMHWGHVGDLDFVAAKLREIAVFLGDEEV